MLTVHHLRRSQSERIVWLCEELAIDYQLQLYDRRSDTRLAPDAYKALHPAATAPVLTDGGTVLAESGAICDYLVAWHGGGRLVPGRDDPDFADHLFWFHWSNASYMPTLSMQRVLAVGGADLSRLGFVGDRAERNECLIADRLAVAPYFGGRALSTADIMMVFTLTTMRSFVGDDTPLPASTQAYVDRIRARPAYRRAMAKAEPL